MIVIIDYGIGNLMSIKNMLKKAGFGDVIISSKEEDILTADKLILPGVGNFDYGMTHLENAGFIDTLNKKVLHDKTPILGICLGAQLLTKGSEEGNRSGLSWVNAKTVRFDPLKMSSNHKVPHMGWGDVKLRKESKLFDNMPSAARFYFVHSYHIQCEHAVDELLSCDYGYMFTAGIEHENIIGVQFHPEKSHKFGLTLLRNFVQNY